MNSVLKFTPDWLKTTFLPITLEKNSNIYKNITLEINDKNSKAILYNEIDINSIILSFPKEKKKSVIKTTKLNREIKLLNYNMLDDRNYYFTPQDFDNFLNDETFNIDLCNINSPLFKNNETHYETHYKTHYETHYKTHYETHYETHNKNNIKNTSYNKFTDRLEDYYLYINHVDQYIDNEDYSDNYQHENYNDSSDEEFDLN